MDNLQLIKQENFGDVQFDFYRDDNSEMWLTRDQIGRGLEYARPSDAIQRIHERHNSRLDCFSTTVKLTGVDGKLRNHTVYNAKGVYEICRWSEQPKADALYDWVYDVLEDIRKHGMYMTNEVLEQVMHDPRSWVTLVTAYADEKERNALLEAEKQVLENKIEADKPLVNFANAVADVEDLITVERMAKLLCSDKVKIGRNKRLENSEVIYRHYFD